MYGSVGILNVGAGDTKLTFDRNNPQERIRAARIVKDMIRRGYALLISIPPKKKGGEVTYRRATDFDENTCEYIIADFDPVEAQRADEEQINEEAVETAASGTGEARESKAGSSKKPRGRKQRVKAENVSAISVARTAGG